MSGPANQGARQADANLTVVTVVKDNLPYLKKTYESLALQDDQDFEWLVLDGLSKDGTLAWLKGLSRPRFRFVSEKDKSIYNAMNKAAGMVGTEYFMFLNAGDTLCERGVLGRVLAEIRAARPLLAYGNCVIEANAGFPRRERGGPIGSRALLFYGRIPCHQATIVSRTAFDRAGPYDESLRIYADREWLIRLAAREGMREFLHLGFPIVNYDPGGFSYKHFFKYTGEYFRMIGGHGNPAEIAAGAAGWMKMAVYICLARWAERRAGKARAA